MLEGLKKEERYYKKSAESEHRGIAVRECYITEDVGWYSGRKKVEETVQFWGGVFFKTT